jgi:hypothetical protein
MSRPLLNQTELATVLGVTRDWINRHRTSPKVTQFEVKQPMGQRKYARALVEKFLAGESVVRFGKGSRSW